MTVPFFRLIRRADSNTRGLGAGRRLRSIRVPTLHLQRPPLSSVGDSTSKRFDRFTMETTPALGEPAAQPSVHLKYSDEETKQIEYWVSVAEAQQGPSATPEGRSKILRGLNDHLSTRTTILGSRPSRAETALYQWLKPWVERWTPEQRTGQDGYHYIVRYFDFLQNSPRAQLSVPGHDKVQINADQVLQIPEPADPKEEKERKRKERNAIAQGAESRPSKVPGTAKQSSDLAQKEAANGPNTSDGNGANNIVSIAKSKKEKQLKPAKQQPQKPAPASTSPRPSLIDLRVGHILKAVNHPNADSLYVSTIACGDQAGLENTSEYEGQVVRTVCSGLNGLIPLPEMQDRKVVVVCNLKPVTMRGIKSTAMVLAASPRLAPGQEDDHKGPVELAVPPADANPGEKVWFEGWEGEPEGILNPKKKIWEMVQPGFTTTDDLKVSFDPEAAPQVAGDAAKVGMALLRTKSGGYCTVMSLKNAIVR